MTKDNKDLWGFVLQIFGICVMVGGTLGSIKNLLNANELSQCLLLGLVFLVFLFIGLVLYALGRKFRK